MEKNIVVFVLKNPDLIKKVANFPNSARVGTRTIPKMMGKH